MFLRSDLRYGDDDPLSWPQPYVHQYCHLAVIRSPPLNLSQSHPNAPLHWLPGGNDFHEADSAGECRGPGFLHHHRLASLQNRVNIITEKARGTTLSDGAKDLKHMYMLLLHDFLEHLKHLPMSLEKVQLNVRETQRVSLYLQVLLDYMLVYKPQINLISDSTAVRMADSGVTGAFTTNMQIAQDFF
ncbi:hypothetical protein EDD18DRAFT_1345455 [Armillaria luteobubalina]|uniref:Uncharacterized protein n=1 Tax=Armillaria luteobubalina TaxID=153913 RepID=A0AA39QHT8_9AGAR|nr:hypothetical protein EDD18DRAFT_1345455 [Armillaria luteobubalina]